MGLNESNAVIHAFSITTESHASIEYLASGGDEHRRRHAAAVFGLAAGRRSHATGCFLGWPYAWKRAKGLFPRPFINESIELPLDINPASVII